MGFSSQSGQVGMIIQSTPGTYANPGAAAPNDGIFMRTRSGSIGVTRELLIPDPEIGGHRDIQSAYLGPVAYSGEYEFYGRMESLASILYGVCGTKASTPTGTTYGDDLVGVHVLTPAAALPIYSIEEDVAGGIEVFNFNDVVFNSVSLECSPDGYLMGTCSVMALGVAGGATKTASPEWDDTPLLVGTSMTVDLDGVTTYIVRDFSMDFTNNIEDDVYSLGSIGIVDLTPKRRELTMNMTIRPEDGDLWRESVFGGTAATTPLSGAAVQKTLDIHIESYAPIGTGTATKFQLDIACDAVVVKPFELSPSGDDVIEFDLEIQAIRPSDANPLVTFTVTNGFDEVK